MGNKIVTLKISVLLAILLVVMGCVEPFNPTIIDKNYNYLVVDGFLNSRDGVATVKLSRTLPVYSENSAPAEQNAQVKIVDEDGTEYLLSESKGAGIYERSNLAIDANKKYRLFIQTADNEQYLSEFIPIKVTPKIDSVFWIPSPDGIRFYVNSTDLNNSTKYYRWDCVETYEYNSAYSSGLKIVSSGVVATRFPAEYINKCWKTNPSGDIRVTSTIASAEDAVRNFELKFIEKGSLKITQTYSILVRQFALTEDAYNYWSELEQTTEKLGGLFDAMPSQLSGNISNISTPDKMALGYFSAGTVEEKRLYVNFYDLPDYLQYFNYGCSIDTILAKDISRYSPGTLLIASYGSPVIIGYLTSTAPCIDCRLQGGTTTKPSFWK